MTVGSNFESTQPLSNARRWSKEAKDYINVPRSAMIEINQLLFITPFVKGITSGIGHCFCIVLK